MLMTGCYQKLAPWICIPVDRTSRMYLEEHLELLASEFEQFLECFIHEHCDHPGEQRRLRTLQQLLRDSRIRGGTRQAVREAYINMCSGLILDLPTWLVELEHQLVSGPRVGWTERMISVHKIQLKSAIEYVRADCEIAPEIVAELQYRLGTLFLNDIPERSIGACGSAIEYFEAALRAYTAEHYPLQCAKTLVGLGDAYRHFPAVQPGDNLAKVLGYYQEAVQIYRACIGESQEFSNQIKN
jgi:hypothetical protein